MIHTWPCQKSKNRLGTASPPNSAAALHLDFLELHCCTNSFNSIVSSPPGSMPSVEALRSLRRALSLFNGSPQPLCKPIRTRIKPRPFSTSHHHRAHEPTEIQGPIIAAPPIPLNDEPLPILKRVRIVPESPSYFTGKPRFTDDLLLLSTLLRKYQTLPVCTPGTAPRVAWKDIKEYNTASEHVKSGSYAKLLRVLKRLNQIHPSLMPEEVTSALQKFKRAVQPSMVKPRPVLVDEFGRARGVGRRKTSTARAWLVEGEGEVLINGRTLTQFFGRLHDRESAVWALKSTDRIDKYNVFALVKGGGVTGQAEALTLAVAKALLVHEPALKPALRRGTSISFSMLLVAGRMMER